ncbi:MAG: glutamate--cysteine ligase [Alphaproteobacteria bacterium]|nr:glutamate--cysteine ligase [Alphaproteobacteria bacterium]
MSAPPSHQGPALTSKQQLVDYLAAGCKPEADWRIGTEHEKFAFRWSDLRALPYEGEAGIGALLDGLTRFGWERVEEKGKVIALRCGKTSVTLEPGGQVELSGAPMRTVHQTCDEVHQHLDQMRQVGDELGIGLVGVGFQPKWRRDEIPWMPKGRYKIMRAYMPTKGNLGLDMMLRTCTIQVNLDFSSEADMVRKFRVAIALQPVATALFANSPFTEGKPNGFLSYRSHIWTDTDPDRTGILPFVFEDGMGFERYVDHALDVPMYFVYRNGQYIDASGQSFRDFLAGRLPALPGEKPGIGDWEDHLTTLFPEVRLKHFLELRGADGGPWDSICALPAFWVGLLYDSESLAAAWDLVKDWTVEDHRALRANVPKTALDTPVAGRSMREFAGDVLAIARAGLIRRAEPGKVDADERDFLDPLLEIVETGITPAQGLLTAYNEEWNHSVDGVFRDCAY